MKLRTSLSRTSTLMLTGALVLTGCGATSTRSSVGAASSRPSTGPAASGPHNAQDISFATDMLPHHTQAVEMAEMALSRATDPKVQALAKQIKIEQAPEISSMRGWLAGWGKPAAAGESHEMSGMHGGAGGMMSDGDMQQLDKASGQAFAKRWLTGMTRHHQGAVEMARTELTNGQNLEAKALATGIVGSQSAEIATMKTLLAGL